jgi:hypothetical protein
LRADDEGAMGVMTWIEITETEYIEALEVLPPALRLDDGVPAR